MEDDYDDMMSGPPEPDEGTAEEEAGDSDEQAVTDAWETIFRIMQRRTGATGEEAPRKPGGVLIAIGKKKGSEPLQP